MTAPTEKRFEQYIENSLLARGYVRKDHREYDRALCLIPGEVTGFIRDTQPEAWKRIMPKHSESTLARLLRHISSEVEKRGVVDVLRNGIKEGDQTLRLVYFQPNSGLNRDHEQLYTKNRFSLVRQLRYSGANENSIDMVLFINGLPVVTMELKNNLSGQNYKDAEKQYKTARDPREPLLRFTRCVVHFCVDEDQVSMTTRLSGDSTHFLPFNKGIENPVNLSGYKSSYLWEEVLEPASLCDIIENFVHVSRETTLKWDGSKGKTAESRKELLVFPRYHQLEVIRKLKATVREEGPGHNYLIQHTTGSGKSYSIGWLAHLLTSLYRSKDDTERIFDSIIVVTDRVVLDRQLQATIKQLEQTRGVVAKVEKGSSQLKRHLESGKDIIVTTIQKFPYISSQLASMSDRTFGVIIDEVHSSQTGETAKHLKKALSSTGSQEDDPGMEDKILREIESRGRQPHISFFGFTGTPKNKTLELFGRKNDDDRFEAFHYYTMQQSIHEGFTLDVLQNYTTYKRWFKVVQKDEEEREVVKGRAKRAVFQFVDSHGETIHRKVQIILDQFRHRTEKKIGGEARAMVVVRSRLHCVLFFKEMSQQMKEKGFPYSCLVAFSGTVSHEGVEYTEDSLNKENRLAAGISIAKGLKDPRYRILIVSNKFQTGYDEPLMHTMFIDKRLDGIQCVQTLSRLNRTARGKTDTFILDFVNKYEEVIESFKPFYTTTLLSEETDKEKIHEIEQKIMRYNLYTKFDVEKFNKLYYEEKATDEELQPVIDVVVARWKELTPAERRRESKSEIQSFIRIYGYLSQIIPLGVYYEMLFIFLKYLNRKLPKTQQFDFDVSNAIDLESLRIDRFSEHSSTMTAEPGIVDPIGVETGGRPDEPRGPLSELIKNINKVYGDTLTEAHHILLRQVSENLQKNETLKTFMTADNSEQNKKKKFEQEFNRLILPFVRDDLKFYQKMSDKNVKPIVVEYLYNIWRRAEG
ncbi:MAG: hypothetical protein AMXMBFR49_16820 [Chlorobiota bacterium]